MSDEFFRRSGMDLEDLGDGEADLFRADDAYPGAPDPAPQWGPTEGPLRVVPASEASALLRIKLPDSPPVPATTLRPDAPPIERAYDAATMLSTSINPARPTALPGDVLALTTATMVVPLPGALTRAGAGRPGQRSTLLTASVPPDLASRAEADLLSDTVEQFFGDFDAIGRELAAERAEAASRGALAAAGFAAEPVGAEGGFAAEAGIAGVEGAPAGKPADPGGAGFEPAADPGYPARPRGEEHGPGRYGVPTQMPGYDAARRSPVGMRYLGGIFHDSSGESSFYDPQTASLVPLGRHTAEFRRPVFPPAPAAPPRAATPLVPPSRPAPVEQPTRMMPAQRPRPEESRSAPPDRTDAEHWEHHHPDHHRSRPAVARRRKGRVMLVSAVAAVLAFGCLYGAAVALEGEVPDGTVVDGVAIGGMSRTAAAAKLESTLGPGLSAPIRLAADGQALTLDPAAAGLRVDWDATVAAAAAGRADPFVALPAIVGTRRTFTLRVTIDRAALHDALAKATAVLDRPMVDGGVTFQNGVPTPVAPKPGRMVDVDAATENVANAYESAAAALGTAQAAGPVRRLGGDRVAPAGVALPLTTVVPAAAGTLAAAPSAPSSTGGPTAHGATPTAGQSAPSSAPAVPDPAPAPASASQDSASALPPVTLTVRTLQPTVTPAEVARVMQEQARPAMSGPVTVVTGSVRTTLKPAVLGKYLAFVPDGHGALVPKLDGAGVRTEMDQNSLARLEQPPVSATFTVADGKPVLVPGKNGTGYAPQAISDAVIPVLTKTANSQRVAVVPAGPLPPALTTDAAQALGVRDVMGTYTASFGATSQRSANVRRAADLVRGQIVQPGATFSLNQALGARTAANGYIPDPSAATAGSQDAGGGASAVATGLFNAEFQAGLKDVEHHPHASLTDRFPAGMEAVSAFPDVDLKFQNDSAAPVYLWTQTTDSAVTVAVLGQKDFTSVQTEISPHYGVVAPKTVTGSSGSCTPADGVPGFQIDVTRILVKDGQDPVRQVFHTVYAPQDKVVCPPSGSSANGPGPAQTSPPAGPASASSPGPSSSGGTGGSTYPSPPYTPPASLPPGSQGGLLGGLLGAPSQPKH